jgi:hypothetical protein
MNQNHIICINPNTGHLIDENILSDNPTLFSIKCNQNNGMVLNKDDWIEPSKGYICKDDNMVYHSKRDCTRKQMINKRTNYQKKSIVNSNIPINIIDKMHPYDKQISRIMVLFITFLIAIIIFVLWLFVLQHQKLNGLDLFISNNIYIFIFIILLVGITLFLFCPFKICYLDQELGEFRYNFLSYIHKQFCYIFNYVGLTIPGCIVDVNICDLTNNRYPTCDLLN